MRCSSAPGDPTDTVGRGELVQMSEQENWLRHVSRPSAIVEEPDLPGASFPRGLTPDVSFGLEFDAFAAEAKVNAGEHLGQHLEKVDVEG